MQVVNDQIIANDDVQSKETVSLKYQPPVQTDEFRDLGGE